MKRLVLFDIDGTLLNGGRLWREVFEQAFSELFPGVSFPKVPFSGKTDRQICREALDLAGLGVSDCDGLIGRYLEVLAKALDEGRGSEVEVLPGVHPLLQALRGAGGVRLGLLTGNVRHGANLKLGAVDLGHYFGCPLASGAFGDDHSDRYQLPAIAVRRIFEETGTSYSGKEIVIIGDTPHDVKCGRSIGVCAIGVGTGRPEYRQALLDSEPDHYFDDFRSTDNVLRAILAGEGV